MAERERKTGRQRRAQARDGSRGMQEINRQRDLILYLIELPATIRPVRKPDHCFWVDWAVEAARRWYGVGWLVVAALRVYRR